MRLPALLPEDLKGFEVAPDDDALFERLLAVPLLEAIRFFVAACEDETWCQTHAPFIRQTIAWMTGELYQERLQRRFALQAVQAIQKHFHALKEFLPFKLIITVEGKEFYMSSLMVGTCSELLYDIVRTQCDEKGEGIIVPQQDITLQGFEIFKKFIETGEVKDLYRYEPEQLLTVMKQASVIDLTGLIDQCADVLKRYLTKGNVIDHVLLAQEDQSLRLRDHCADFISQADMGILIRKMPLEHLGFEFLEFTDDTLAIFNRLKGQITHLSISGRLTEEVQFGKVINQCPTLIRLDLGRSQFFSRHLEEIPKTLTELDLSMCPWLTDANLKKMVAICSGVRKLLVGSNVQITSTGWPALSQLRALEGLDISRCHQITDTEFKLILTAQPTLKELRLDECKGLSDQSFIELALKEPHLTTLSVARCMLTDGGLIEIASRCPYLLEVDLTRCEKLSFRGISELLRLVPRLQQLTVTQCPLSEERIRELRKMRPYMTLICL